MNRRLSTCLLFGALLSLSLTARGQDTGSTIAQKMILSGPSFKTEEPTEAARGTSDSVSLRELSIPERTAKAFQKGMDRLSKNDPAGSLVHLQAPLPSFQTFMRLIMTWV
jgi:hypothetical protein